MRTLLNPIYWVDRFRPLPIDRGMVIVTGMQKSGTTAIAKLLGAAAGETVCSDPLHRLWEQNVDFRYHLYSRGQPLRNFWRGHRRLFEGRIIKDPDFVSLVPDLQEMFPEAVFVFVVRDPRDTIRSILNRLKLPGNPGGFDLSSASLPALWNGLLRGEEPGAQGDNYVEVLAHRWVRASELAVGESSRDVLVKYEDFCRDKVGIISELARHLGYSKLSRIEHLVDVQYQPKGDNSARWKDYFGKESLAQIERIVEPHMEKFGYDAAKRVVTVNQGQL